MLAQNIRFLRRKQGWSQDILAEKLGYKSYTTVQKWESGTAEPPLKVVNALASLFGVNINDLTHTDLACGDSSKIREYNQTVHKQTKNADVFIARLDSAVQKSGHYAEVMKQLECIGYSEDTVKVIRTALDQYRNMRKQEAQAAAYPAQTPLELVAQLRKIGLSNGSSLGYHCGIADEAADWIEERVREEQQGRVIHLPCAVGDTVYRICPQAKHIQIGQMWSGKVVKSPCDRCPWSCCSCVNIGFQPDAPQFEHIVKPVVFQHAHDIIQAMPYFGTVFFTDEESAKAYLAERMGEQND